MKIRGYRIVSKRFTFNFVRTSWTFHKKATVCATENDSTTLEAWFHLGGLYFTTGKYELAKEALSKVIAINPNYKTAGAGYQACDQMLNMKK